MTICYGLLLPITALSSSLHDALLDFINDSSFFVRWGWRLLGPREDERDSDQGH